MARYEFTVYQHIVTCLAYFTRVDEANSLLPNHPWRLMILVSILDKYIFWSNLAIHQPASFQSHYVADDFGNIMVNHCKILTVVKKCCIYIYIYTHVTYIYIFIVTLLEPTFFIFFWGIGDLWSPGLLNS